MTEFETGLRSTNKARDSCLLKRNHILSGYCHKQLMVEESASGESLPIGSQINEINTPLSKIPRSFSNVFQIATL